MIEVRFKVGLIRGEIVATTVKGRAGTYANYDNIYQADFCSLGILVQNLAEKHMKEEMAKDFMEPSTPLSMRTSRTVFGKEFSYTAAEIFAGRARLKEEHAEYFV